MIKRSALEAMHARYPELNCKNDHQNRDFDDYCAVFDCMIDPVSKRYLSEDYAFCRRCEVFVEDENKSVLKAPPSQVAADGWQDSRGCHDDPWTRGESTLHWESWRETEVP